ncbi:MAG: hypothetical protein CMJ78_00115 [Planctomycetaceae bacterium]|nr:hypothetical protein [Planctomycetaceae bacterium]
MLRKLWKDDCGFVISAELTLVLTIAVLAMVVGLSEMAVAINTELNDLSNAFGHLRQTYRYTGFIANDGGQKYKSSYAGSTWTDNIDDCDDNTTLELVCGAAAQTADEKP